MKLFKTLACALALCAAFSTQARSLDEVKKSATLMVATEGQFAPWCSLPVSWKHTMASFSWHGLLRVTLNKPS